MNNVSTKSFNFQTSFLLDFAQDKLLLLGQYCTLCTSSIRRSIFIYRGVSVGMNMEALRVTSEEFLDEVLSLTYKVRHSKQSHCDLEQNIPCYLIL